MAGRRQPQRRDKLAVAIGPEGYGRLVVELVRDEYRFTVRLRHGSGAPLGETAGLPLELLRELVRDPAG